jgi:hypothetical protein
MARFDIDDLCSFSHPERLIEMKSDLEATAHAPEQLFSMDGRLVELRPRKRSDSNCRSVKQLLLDNQAGMPPHFPSIHQVDLRFPC